MKYINRIWPFIFIIIFSLFSFTPFFKDGFFPIHDDTQVVRVFEMGTAIKDKMVPVRWTKELGYGFGYPIFNFYDPLVYYIGGGLNAIGVDALTATKAMMVFAIILSAISMYMLAGEIWGVWGGILSSLLYVYAPYHGVDIYVRGDFTESLAYAFVPLVFFGLWKIYKNFKLRYVLVLAFAFAFVIMSHNLIALMILPFIVLFSLFLLYLSKNKKKTAIFVFLGLFLGLLLSAFYWVPAIFEMKFTNVISQVGGGADFRDHFICLNQLWTSPWGYGGSAKGCIDGLSFMIGKYHIILSLLIFISSLVLLFGKKFSKAFGQERDKLFLIIFSYICFLFCIFLMLSISKPIWEAIAPMGFIQYPWRFLILVVFFSSFISGGFFWIVKKYIRDRFLIYFLGMILVFFLIFVSVKFFEPQVTLNKTAEDYTNLFVIKWNTSKISDEYMPAKFQKPKSPNQIANLDGLSSKNVKISDITQKTQKLEFNYNGIKDTSFVVPLAFYPAWKAYLDNKQIDVLENPKGMQVLLEKGKHNFYFKFEQTPVEKLSNLLSISGILLITAGIIKFRKRYG